MHRNQSWGKAACRIEPVQDAVKQVFGSGKLGNLERSFGWQASTLKDTGSEGKMSSVKHEMGAVGGGCFDTEAAEHGFQLPLTHAVACLKLRLASIGDRLVPVCEVVHVRAGECFESGLLDRGAILLSCCCCLFLSVMPSHPKSVGESSAIRSRLLVELTSSVRKATLASAKSASA